MRQAETGLAKLIADIERWRSLQSTSAA